MLSLFDVAKRWFLAKFAFDDIEFSGVKFELTINGWSDLVVEAIDKGKSCRCL